MACCYGLPIKIHKPDCLLRIIVSALGSPTYNVVCFLHNVFKKAIPQPRSYIGDSWKFVKFVSGQSIVSDELLVFLDVTLLFTNIPVELVMKSIEERWHLIAEVTKFNLLQFKFAVEMVLSSTCVVYLITRQEYFTIILHCFHNQQTIFRA